MTLYRKARCSAYSPRHSTRPHGRQTRVVTLVNDIKHICPNITVANDYIRLVLRQGVYGAHMQIFDAGLQ